MNLYKIMETQTREFLITDLPCSLGRVNLPPDQFSIVVDEMILYNNNNCISSSKTIPEKDVKNHSCIYVQLVEKYF